MPLCRAVSPMLPLIKSSTTTHHAKERREARRQRVLHRRVCAFACGCDGSNGGSGWQRRVMMATCAVVEEIASWPRPHASQRRAWQGNHGRPGPQSNIERGSPLQLQRCEPSTHTRPLHLRAPPYTLSSILSRSPRALVPPPYSVFPWPLAGLAAREIVPASETTAHNLPFAASTATPAPPRTIRRQTSRLRASTVPSKTHPHTPYRRLFPAAAPPLPRYLRETQRTSSRKVFVDRSLRPRMPQAPRSSFF